MSQGEDEEATRVYSSIGHPVRKKIVELLVEKQRAGFKDIKNTLNVSVGTTGGSAIQHRFRSWQ